MPEVVACGRVDPLSDAVVDLADLFETYRTHYDQAPALAATREWVHEMADAGS